MSANAPLLIWSLSGLDLASDRVEVNKRSFMRRYLVDAAYKPASLLLHGNALQQRMESRMAVNIKRKCGLRPVCARTRDKEVSFVSHGTAQINLRQNRMRCQNEEDIHKS